MMYSRSRVAARAAAAVVLCAGGAAVAAAEACPPDVAPCCRFAPLFKDADWSDPATQRRFVTASLAAERRFFASPNISFDPETGMTYDGISLDATTGEPKMQP